MDSGTKEESLYHNPDFVKLWVGHTISNFGSGISNLALPLTAVLVLAATPAQMGILSALESLSVTVFGLVAGVWVDRFGACQCQHAVPDPRCRASSSHRFLLLLSKTALLVGLPILILLGSLRLFAPLKPIISPLPSTATITANPGGTADSTPAMFGFDLQRTHFNYSEHILTFANVAHLVPLWVAHPGDVIYSSPAVANESVYIGSDDGRLYAFDASTGAVLWSYTIGGASTSPYLLDSSPEVFNAMVYVGSADRRVFAFHLMPMAYRKITCNTI